MVYQQVPGCPCAYVELMEFDELVQQVLHEHRARPFRVQHVRDVRYYLVHYDEDDFRNLRRDRRLLSFRNGVLVLPEARFVPVRDGVAPPELEGRVARHHVDLEYTGGRETPLMDALVEALLGDATDATDASDASRRDVLYMLLGRHLFQVRELDNWQVVPLLLGGGGGAAAVLHVVEAMFDPGAVGCGYANKRVIGGGVGGGGGSGRQRAGAKEVLIVHHAATQLKRMPKDIFTAMVSGECRSVRNGVAASRDPWRAPMLVSSDRPLDYEDSGGQVRRRVVPFYCHHVPPDAPTASEVLDELPNVVARCLAAYLDAVNAVGRRSFWAFCPESLRQAQTKYNAT